LSATLARRSAPTRPQSDANDPSPRRGRSSVRPRRYSLAPTRTTSRTHRRLGAESIRPAVAFCFGARVGDEVEPDCVNAVECPWGSETRIRSRRGGVILVDQPAEQVPVANISRVDRDRLRGLYERSGEAEGAMGSPAVVLLDIRPERPIEMPPPEDERPVEALGPDRLRASGAPEEERTRRIAARGDAAHRCHADCVVPRGSRQRQGGPFGRTPANRIGPIGLVASSPRSLTNAPSPV